MLELPSSLRSEPSSSRPILSPIPLPRRNLRATDGPVQRASERLGERCASSISNSLILVDRLRRRSLTWGTQRSPPRPPLHHLRRLRPSAKASSEHAADLASTSLVVVDVAHASSFIIRRLRAFFLVLWEGTDRKISSPSQRQWVLPRHVVVVVVFEFIRRCRLCHPQPP